MAEPITLTQEDGMMRLRTTYEIDMNGAVAINVLAPNVDHTILALQALACEFSVAALSRRAQNFRSMIAKGESAE